jgi:hypothetical protein
MKLDYDKQYLCCTTFVYYEGELPEGPSPSCMLCHTFHINHLKIPASSLILMDLLLKFHSAAMF